LKEKLWEVKLALLIPSPGAGPNFCWRVAGGARSKRRPESALGYDETRYSRWSKNPGSARIGEEKVPIKEGFIERRLLTYAGEGLPRSLVQETVLHVFGMPSRVI
jgi:hypothetical protein